MISITPPVLHNCYIIIIFAGFVQVLQDDDKNVKAYFRRGQVRDRIHSEGSRSHTCRTYILS